MPTQKVMVSTHRKQNTASNEIRKIVFRIIEPSGDSGEGDRGSGLIVISIPGSM